MIYDDAKKLLKGTKYIYNGSINMEVYDAFMSAGKEISGVAVQTLLWLIPYYNTKTSSSWAQDDAYLEKTGNLTYLFATNTWISAHMFPVGIRSSPTITKVMQELENLGMIKVMWKTNSKVVGGRIKGYAPTRLGFSLIYVPTAVEVQDVLDATVEEEWKPSAYLQTFINGVKAKCGNKYRYTFYKKDGKPIQYMVRADKYLKQLMEGTFITANKLGSVELPKLTLEEIINVVEITTVYTNGSPNIGDIFYLYHRKISPFLAYYKSINPDPIASDPSHVEKAKRNNPHLLEHIKNIKDPELCNENNGMWEMAYRFDNYFNDKSVVDSISQFNKTKNSVFVVGKREVFIKWYIQTYVEYAENYKNWGKTPKYGSLSEWFAHTVVHDNVKWSVWYRFVRWAYENQHMWLTDNPVMVNNILADIDKQQNRDYD